MITQRHIPLVTYLNDHEYHCHFYGEAFMDEKVLWYFDGDFLRIVGYDVELEPVDRKRFLRVLEIARSQFDVEQITFESSKKIAIKRACPDFERSVLSYPKCYDRELFVTPNSYRCSKSMKELIRRARKNGYECRQLRQSCLSMQQWQLVQIHIDEFDDSPYHRSEYLSALMALVQHQDSTVFESVQDGQLTGFAVAKGVHPYAAFHVLMLAPEARFASDLLYFSLLNHYLDLGYERISLGLGVSKGVYQYKRKWTDDEGLPGLFDIHWEKQGARHLADDLWFSRYLWQ
jgi:hypothetical protein